MTTVAEVIAWSLKDAGVIGEGEAASAEASNDAFNTLKQMLALWQVDNVHVYAQTETSFSPNGSASYTVGALGTVVMTRPAKIDAAFWRSNSLDYPIRVLGTFEEYESIVQKTQSGQPQALFYNPTYTLGTLYLYPQPSTGTVHLITQAALPELASQTATITLPPEYVLPIRASLAVLLCAMFQTPVRPELAALAQSSWRIVKRNNLRIGTLSAAICGHGRGNIFAGQ
jgi:hypothetical protein